MTDDDGNQSKKLRKHYYYGQWRGTPKPARPFSSILGWHLDNKDVKGWRVSDFVSRMQVVDPDTKIQRQAVHAYLQGKTRAGNEHIRLMAKTLGVDVSDLVEREGLQIVVDEGKHRDVVKLTFDPLESYADVSITARIPSHVARSIIMLLRAADKDAGGAVEPSPSGNTALRNVRKRSIMKKLNGAARED